MKHSKPQPAQDIQDDIFRKMSADKKIAFAADLWRLAKELDAKKSILESIDPRHLLVTIADILEGLGVKYAVTGGMAVFVWGKPRFTADIDIIVRVDFTSAKKLYAALERLGDAGYISQEAVDRALEQKGEFNFIDGASGVKVDFWVLGKDAFGVEQLKRRRGRKIIGKNIFFVSPEDLILSKLLWHKENESSKQ